MRRQLLAVEIPRVVVVVPPIHPDRSPDSYSPSGSVRFVGDNVYNLISILIFNSKRNVSTDDHGHGSVCDELALIAAAGTSAVFVVVLLLWPPTLASSLQAGKLNVCRIWADGKFDGQLLGDLYLPYCSLTLSGSLAQDGQMWADPHSSSHFATGWIKSALRGAGGEILNWRTRWTMTTVIVDQTGDWSDRKSKVRLVWEINLWCHDSGSGSGGIMISIDETSCIEKILCI